MEEKEWYVLVPLHIKKIEKKEKMGSILAL